MRHLGLLTLFSAFLIISSGCGSSKDATDAKNATAFDEPCTKEEHRSNDEYFRATQIGESSDMSTAKKIAMQNARSQLATSIQNVTKRVVDNYVQQQDVNNKSETKKKFEDISRTVVNQKLSDVRVNCDKVIKGEEGGEYTYFVNLEMSKKAYMKGLTEKISKDEELKLEYDKQEFEDTLEKEMEKLEDEQP